MLTLTEEDINEYLLSKEKININAFSSEEKKLIEDIDKKIEDYNSNKDKINSCVDNMGEYRNYVVLVKERLVLYDKYDSQTLALGSYVDAGRYQNALQEVRNIKKTVREFKENLIRRKEYNIQVISNNQLQSWDSLLEVYDIYEEYLNLEIQGDYYLADSKYQELTEKFSDAIVESGEESITEAIDEIDGWYENNIGSCFDIFEEYS
ncbi:MAG: hypothetical protein AABY07_06235 [Nanoarchaeota archaeon]